MGRLIGVGRVASRKNMKDQKGYKILQDTYWSSAGWRKEPQVSKEDFEYAKAAGFMFDPVKRSHNQSIDLLQKAFSQIERAQVTDAFLASISTRRLDWRSALGSYALARHFPKHHFKGKLTCSICGEFKQRSEPVDLSRLNFERLKWGGVFHWDPIYIGFDLSRFALTQVAAPSEDDLSIFGQILRMANSMPDESRPNDLEKSLAALFNSNQHERRVLIQILGYCGLLQPEGFPSFFEGFVPYGARKDRPVYKIDWTYPVSWWQGKHRVNRTALDFYFPGFWERFCEG